MDRKFLDDIFEKISNIEELYNSFEKILKIISESYYIGNLSLMLIKNSNEEFDFIDLKNLLSAKGKVIERIFTYSSNKFLRYVESYILESYSVEERFKSTPSLEKIFKTTFLEIYNDKTHINNLKKAELISKNYIEKRIENYKKLLKTPYFKEAYPNESDYIKKLTIPLKNDEKIYGVLIADAFNIPGHSNESKIDEKYLNSFLEIINYFTYKWAGKINSINKEFEIIINTNNIFLQILSSIEKPSYTLPHSTNCQLIYMEFLKFLNRENIKKVSPLEFFSCKYGSLFHDIGKSMVPASILLKTGSLTPKEFEEMKKHPENGYNFLKNTILPEKALKIIRSHHEKLDGSGYPDGLKENEIDDLVKIFTIVDIFEALTGLRHYRVTFHSRIKGSNLVDVALKFLFYEARRDRLSIFYVEQFENFLNFIQATEKNYYLKDLNFNNLKKVISENKTLTLENYLDK